MLKTKMLVTKGFFFHLQPQNDATKMTLKMT